MLPFPSGIRKSFRSPKPNCFSPVWVVAMAFSLLFSPRLRFFTLSLLLLFWSSTSDELTVASHSAKLQLPPGQVVEGSPGVKPGAMVICNRVNVRGVSRVKNLKKYAHSLKVSVDFALEDASSRVPVFEVCFHRNASIGVGMCPPGRWERVTKGHWTRSMSPFDNKIIDIRMPNGSTLKLIEVSTEEEVLLHRLVFLITGVIFMMLARGLSKSVVFYYGSAMAIGILLVVLMILFQGMKLLPTGRKSSLAIFMYSSVVGVATFLLRYLSGLMRSILVEIGISEDMHNPLGIFLVVCLILAGAWLGFWSVRKLVLEEDGTVDATMAHFVEWTILIFAAAMILESSLDTLLAAEALVFLIIISATARSQKSFRFVRRLYRRMSKLIRSKRQDQYSKYSSADQWQNLKVGSSPLKSPTKTFRLAPCTSPVAGFFSGSAKTAPQTSPEEETYYSTFHSTPDRKRFSKDEWKAFTKESTARALKELLSSPDFGHWAAANADRITIAPSKKSDANKAHRRFYWF